MVLDPDSVGWFAIAKVATSDAPPSTSGSQTFLIGLVVTIVGGFLAYVAYERYRKKLRVRRLTKRTRGRDKNAFAELYTALMDDSQQVDADLICTLAVSTASHRSTPWRARRDSEDQSTPQVCLYLAKSGRQLVGFLNVVVDRIAGFAFISYLCVDPDTHVERGRASEALLKAMKHDLKALNPRPLVLFEISPPSADHDASRRKLRLFRSYAESFGYSAHSLPYLYLQLDMEPETLPGKSELTADLCVAAPKDQPFTWGPTEFIAAVEWIYSNVYHLSFHGHEGYEAYVDTVLSLVRNECSRPGAA